MRAREIEIVSLLQYPSVTNNNFRMSSSSDRSVESETTPVTEEAEGREMEEERNESALIVDLLKDKMVILSKSQTPLARKSTDEALEKLVQEFEAITGTFLKIVC